MGQTFVHMYVNDLTLDMGALGRKALDRLYDRALEVGAIASRPRLDVV
jgi:predicted solute-binding protein